MVDKFPPAQLQAARQDRHFVTALARGLDLLACFRSSDRLLGNQELAQRCKLPRSTVSRLSYTLTQLGYLQYEQSAGKYRLGSERIVPDAPADIPKVGTKLHRFQVTPGQEEQYD